MSGQRFGLAGTGDTEFSTKAPIVQNETHSLKSQPDIWGALFPVVVATL